jgi:hypothetical protein
MKERYNIPDSICRKGERNMWDFLSEEWFWAMVAVIVTTFFSYRQTNITLKQIQEQKQEEMEKNTPRLHISYQIDDYDIAPAINFIITNINFIPVSIIEIKVVLNGEVIAQYKDNYRHFRGLRTYEVDRFEKGEIFTGDDFNYKLPFIFTPEKTYLRRGERGLFWFRLIKVNHSVINILRKEGIPIEGAKLKIVVTDSIGGKHESEEFHFDEMIDQALGVKKAMEESEEHV